MSRAKLDLDCVRYQIATVLAFLEREKHDGEAARHARLAAREIARITNMDEHAVKRRTFDIYPLEAPKC